MLRLLIVIPIVFICLSLEDSGGWLYYLSIVAFIFAINVGTSTSAKSGSKDKEAVIDDITRLDHGLPERCRMPDREMIDITKGPLYEETTEKKVH